MIFQECIKTFDPPKFTLFYVMINNHDSLEAHSEIFIKSEIYEFLTSCMKNTEFQFINAQESPSKL